MVKMRLSLLLIPAAVIVGPFVAAFQTDTSEPVQLRNSSLNTPWDKNDLTRSSTVARAAISVPLRIMPLGDSITWGSLSSTGNGYRGYLGDYLTSLGVPDVDFIGTLKNGKMLDNDNEGHSGSFLSEIKGYSLLSVAARPNIILLHAGTNDMDLNRDVAGAPDRLAAIIDQLFEKCPDATILVAQIISSTDQAMQSRTNSYNAAIADLVNQRQKSQKHIMAVDMSKVLNTATDLADKKHPNDAGYSKMAAAWQNAILRANDAGWIKKPAPYEGLGIGLGIGKGDQNSGSPLCDGPNWVKQGTVADLIRIWSSGGQVAPGVDGSTRDNVAFADIDGDGYDDYLIIFEDGSVKAWRNTGNIPSTDQSRKWEELGTIAAGVGQPGSKVRFADVDGDGRADYLILYDGGAVDAWINTGNIQAGNIARKFESIGTIATGVGQPGSKVRFADIDGDGRADYLVLYDGGSISAWRNTGNLNKGTGKNFEEMGEVAAGVSGVPGSKVRLADFDGDGLADYLVLYDGGAVNGYRNTGNLGRDSSKRNFEDLGTIAAGVSGVTAESVRFADLNGDGRFDYISVSTAGAVDVWLNTGGSKNGGVVRFADLNGDDRDDLLWVQDGGAISAWLNAGGSPQTWTSLGQIATGVQGATVQNIVFADLDGDRLDDYIVINDDGSALGWRNTGNLNPSNGRVWQELGIIATGVGASGNKVRFADINGDRIADYLVVWDTGAVDAWLGTGNVLNDGRNFNKLGRIAAGVGASGKKVQFEDVDGDGLADYLVVWDGGAVEAWRSNGNLEKKPELASWQKLGVIAAGVANQGLVQFGDLNGDKKADYLNIDPDTKAVGAYINQCAGFGDPDIGDDPGSEHGVSDWTTAQCTDPVIVDASIDPSTRWNGVYTPHAWKSVTENWKAKPSPGGLSFPEQASNFFHAPEHMKCYLTVILNDCTSSIQCDDTNHPAGYFIMNSMVALNNMLMNFYDAISRVQISMTTDVNKIQETFAVFPHSSQALKILLDFVGLGFALGVAPMWNSALKRLPFFKANGNKLGTAKDSINSAVSSTITIIKDKQPSSPEDMSKTLAENVNEMCRIWYDSMGELHSQLFDGSDDSISIIGSLFEDGQLMENGYEPPDDMEIQGILSKALYALLIPQAWSLSPDLGVVIIDADVPCGTIDPLKNDLSTEDSNASWVCYRDRMYFLIAAQGDAETCFSNEGVLNCSPNMFSLAPGLTKIDGKAWAGLTKEEIVIGSVNTFEANDRQNGAEPGNTKLDPKSIDTLQDLNVIAPGIIFLPICGIEEARTNWANRQHFHETTPNYPCN